MSGIKNRTYNKRGRPRRNNVTALQQHHLKEKALAPDALFDLDENQPLTIVQTAKKASLPSTASSSLASLLEDTFDKELLTVTERDSSSASTTQHTTNSDATLLSISPCSSLTDNNVIASESSELSSEDDSINTATPPPPPPRQLLAQISTANTTQGVDLDQLPKVHFVKGNLDENENWLHGDDDGDEEIYQQEQLDQEEQLLIQHYQAQQQGNPGSSSALTSNNKDLLKLSRTFNRPENHYIHYNELSDVELYDSVEYDMDEQDQCWLRLYNKERRKELLGDISPYLFECIMDKLEKEWFNLIKDAPKPETEQVLLPEDSACVVCDDTEVENSNAIVFCDGCNVAVHQDCYGIPYIPEGQWLCRKCMISPEFPVSCIFCPNEGGAFKQTNTNQWGHLLCAIWIPEVGVGNTIYMEPIDQIENIPKSRWKLTCTLCRKKQGACIQCDNKHCFSAFHVTCAKAANLCMKMNSQSFQSEEGVILKAYCEKHTPKDYYTEKPSIGVTSSSGSTPGRRRHGGSEDESKVEEEEEEENFVPPARGTTSGRGRRGRGRGRGDARGRGRGRGRPSRQALSEQHQQQMDEANNKEARAHQHHYSTGAPIAPDIILAKIDNLPCVRFSGIRKRPQAVTAIAHYWSLKRESRRGAPLLKRLHLEPWTAYSKYTAGEDDQLVRKTVITLLRTDLEKVRMLSEQVQKRERLKLEQTKKQKAYLEMIFYPLEHVIQPILNQFMEIDRKKLFLNHVTTDEAADYHNIIKQPMCFSEIYQKLANHAYTTLDQFKHDIGLIWTNSMDYNTSDTSFYKVASKLKNASQKLFDSAEAKLSLFDILEDGMLDEQIDDALFTYDATFDEDDLVEVEEHPPVQMMDTEAEARLKLEKERLKAEKNAEHQRAIRARVEGRAKARALREENKRKGILPPVNPVEETKSRSLRKLRDRASPTTLAVSNAPHIPKQDLTLDSTVTDSLAHSPSQLSFHVHDDDTPRTLTESTMEEQQPAPAQPVKHTAEQVNDLKVEQSVDSSNILITQVSSLSATATETSVDLPMEDSLIDQDIKKDKETQASSVTRSSKEKQEEITTSMPTKRKHSSFRVSRRLTRSNGLQASIEELRKRPKISHEARTLYASYNGVSHLDRPHEVYKENRKKHAPVGWVWLEDDDADNDDDDDDEEEDSDDRREESMDVDEASAGEHGSTRKQARLGRNDIPVPEFNKGEIVWARVNKYPSHPAKFLNLSDEEAGPKLVASRRYTGDVLVEFLKVPEIHRFGWVGRRTICEIGDPQVDRQRLEETLQKRMKKKEYIQEAKEGYRCAGSILGLDPEPLLSEVFDRPPPEQKRKRKHPSQFNKLRFIPAIIEDTSSQGSAFTDPFETKFPFRFVTDKRAFVSTHSSDSSMPARNSQHPTFNHSRYSQRSYDSDASSVLPMDVSRPSFNVEPSDYYEHLPSEWTDEQKTRQLLIWLMIREIEIESSPETHVTAEAKRARLVANKLKQKIIKDMKEGKVDVSCYNRPDNMEEVEEKENPINLVNTEKLETLTKANQNFFNEIEEWKRTTGEVYQAHAEAIDAIPTDTAIRYENVDLDFMLLHLHEDQQQFYKKYGTTEEMNTIEAPDVIVPGITHIRQQLNTMGQFQLQTGKAVDKQKSKLAQKIHEREQYIPKSRHYSRAQYVEAILKRILSKSPPSNALLTNN
ncbi:bromodomain and PHD finger-containing protein 3 isoform X5 [Mucor ambiguus]|uniref:Bromodomain and PHD finger-containing protein 3 isoform X5 n=1 Tax=Mucor ambiguus TaxID=91626 RepID=A0A0C9N7H4_9FUNG|nr:bromodomain and PHD finger-containing protein 3 isoform X5 [Mucor ambiguus]